MRGRARAVGVAVGAGACQTPGATFDILIRNGRILDGTGNPWYRADIGIRGDRIVAIGALSEAKAATVVDAADRYVTPGFIDVHSHSGPGLLTDDLKHGQPVLAQGITTVLVNPDGGGPVTICRPARHLREAGHRTRTSACSCRMARFARWSWACRIAIPMRRKSRRWSR